MRHHALQLADYHAWANQRFFDHLKDLPRDIYTREMQSVFPSVSQVFGHLYVVDNIWLGVMSGERLDNLKTLADSLSEETKGKRLEEMEAMFQRLSERYQTFLGSQPDLNQAVLIQHPRLGQLKTSLSEIVQHVVNHGTYHRGNIAAMLRQTGNSGVPTDYIAYLYDMRQRKE